MATILELYDRTNRINDIKGNTPILRKRNFIDVEFELLLDRTPNVFDVTVTHIDNSTDDVTIIIDDGVEIDILKQDDKRIMTNSDLVKNGDIFTWQNIVWLVLMDDIVSVGNYYKFRVRPCNYNLKWITANGTISGNGMGVPCAARNQTLYSLGIRSSYDMIRTLDAKTSIEMPNTEEVRQINRGDIFYIGGDSYYVTMTDKVSFPNVLHMLLGQDEINTQTEEDDIIDKKLINTTIEIINIDNVAEITLLNSLQLIIKTKFNGSIVDNPTITYSSSDDDIAIINPSGLIMPVAEGSVIITANSTAAQSQDSFSLNIVPVVSDNYNTHIVGDESITVYETNSYEANFYNNGVLVVDNGTWILTDLFDNPTSFASIDVVANTCSITANNNKNQQIKLKYYLDTDPSIFAEKIIKIKGIY
jgi:hypothetical protein